MSSQESDSPRKPSRTLDPTTPFLSPDLSAQATSPAHPDGDDTRSFRFEPQGSGGYTNLPEIPGYQLLRVVARGGMGIVLEARDRALGRVVAIKLPLDHQITCDVDRERFLREARSVARLRHPHICAIHEVGEAAGRPYIAMDFIHGETLKAWAAQSHPTARHSGEMIAVLARAVGYAHDHGVVHRDLKPSNVMVDRETGQPVLMDFGLAKETSDEASQLTHTGQVLGTPAYMAPEQAAGRLEQVGPRTDIYALGAILYELLSGRPPYSGTTGEVLRQVQTEDVAPLRRLNPRLHRDLDTICSKAMAREPAQRYGSAQELAAELERFCAGEAILARREGLPARMWRKVRRRPATVATLVSVTFIASLVVGYFVQKDARNRRIEGLLQGIEAELEEQHWSAGRLAWMQQRLAEVQSLDLSKSAAAEKRFSTRVASALRDSFSLQRAPILRVEQIKQVESELASLATYDASLAQTISGEFKERLRRLQSSTLEHPFEKLDAFFQPDQVEVDGKALALKPAPGGEPLSPTPTQIGCLGESQLEVVFQQGSWEGERQLGLALNLAGPQHYLFLLHLPDYLLPDGRVQSSSLDATFGSVADAGGEYNLRIFRNGNPLRDMRIKAGDIDKGPLLLRAGREGEKLTFQVNDLQPFLFYDAYPLAAADPGVFGLVAAAGLRLERITIGTQALPAVPSPLERGDELHSRGRFKEALDDYQQQPLAAVSTAAGQELRYKIGACLQRLNRGEEAERWLQEVAMAEGDRWPLLAACQLWVIGLAQDRLDEVDSIMLGLFNRYDAAQLSSVVPIEVRQHVLSAYSVQNLGGDFLRRDPQRIEKLQRVVPLADLLKGNDYDRIHIRLSLLRAYHLDGHLDDALRTAEEMLSDKTLAGEWENEPTRLLHWQIRTCEEYGWLVRLRGEPQRGLAEVDRRLLTKDGYREAYLPLLLERARLHAALEQWEQAEQDLDDLFRQRPLDQLEYRYVSEACLLRGFLHERNGDSAAAQQAWLAGVHADWLPRWRAAHPESNEQSSYESLSGTKVLTNLALGSLTGRLSARDVDNMTSYLVTYIAGDQSFSMFKDTLRLPPAALAQAWQSPPGRAIAHQMALRNVPWADFIRQPIVLFMATLVMPEALPQGASADQHALIWGLMEETYHAYFITGKVGSRQMLLLMVTWKGVSNALGWNSVASSLEPALRGPLAYLFGLRFERLNKRQEALDFFRVAREDAPPDSLLLRLAQAELDRLQQATK